MRLLGALACVLSGGCSIFLGGGDDGNDPDQPDGGDGCDMELVLPSILVEGEGARLDAFSLDDSLESLPRVIGLRACEALPAGLSIAGDGIEMVGALQSGARAAFAVRVAIDDSRAGEIAIVPVRLLDAEGGEVMSQLVEVEYLPELDGPLVSGRYSFANITSDANAVTGPLVVRSTSAISIEVSLDLDANGEVEGPGGGAGGPVDGSAPGPGGGIGGDRMSGCEAGGGGNATVGTGGLHFDGGAEIADAALLGPDQPRGGGGGGGCSSGGVAVLGGGGGGFLELTAAGGIITDTQRIVSLRGAPGQTDTVAVASGGGAGGSALLRARQLSGQVLFDVRGSPGGDINGDGSGAGADGRVRLDLGSVIEPSVTGSRTCSAEFCVVGPAASVFSGIIFVPTGPLMSSEPIELFAAAGTKSPGAIDVEIDGELVTSVEAGDTITVDEVGVHRVCAVNRTTTGLVIDSDDWRRRAKNCIDVAYIP